MTEFIPHAVPATAASSELTGDMNLELALASTNQTVAAIDNMNQPERRRLMAHMQAVRELTDYSVDAVFPVRKTGDELGAKSGRTREAVIIDADIQRRRVSLPAGRISRRAFEDYKLFRRVAQDVQ